MTSEWNSLAEPFGLEPSRAKPEKTPQGLDLAARVQCLPAPAQASLLVQAQVKALFTLRQGFQSLAHYYYYSNEEVIWISMAETC